MPAKTIVIEPKNVTKSEKVIGALCLLLFVAVWITSIASPFVFVWALVYGYHIIATAIAFVTICAYAPWEKGVLSNALQRIMSYYGARYYQKLSFIFEESTPTSQDPQTFYAIHPHGAFCIGWAMLFCHEVMQHVRFCFAPALYASPFFRLFSRCTGDPGSASKHAMRQYMTNGESLALPPGGFEEATLTCTTQDRVFVKKRTGFIRLCLQYGLQVRPVYVFGEKSLYWNIQGMWKVRLTLNRYGIPTILPFGHVLSPLVPKPNVQVHIVMGAPLVLPKIPNPSKDEVTLWHGKYVAALTRLFEEHKEAAYGEAAKTTKLELW